MAKFDTSFNFGANVKKKGAASIKAAVKAAKKKFRSRQRGCSGGK